VVTRRWSIGGTGGTKNELNPCESKALVAVRRWYSRWHRWWHNKKGYKKLIDSKILIYTITGKAPKSEIKEIMYWLTFKKKMTTFEVKKMISVITKNADYSPDKLVAKTMIEIEGWKARLWTPNIFLKS